MKRKISNLSVARRILACSLLLVVVSSFAVLACGCSASQVKCRECNKKMSAEYTFCHECGAKLSKNTVSDTEALLGTWEAYDETWGRYTYTFYADGSCKGEYLGNAGGVRPSLYLYSYYVGAGDGTWSFEQGDLITLLKVSYRGDEYREHVGVQQYEYEFNEDKTEITIYGVNTYGDRERGSVVWKKISD